MKKYFHLILSFSILVLFIRANGCSEGGNEQNNPQRIIRNPEEELANSIASQKLSIEAQQAMNQQAILMFHDAMDYLRLLGDTSLGEAIRNDAATAFQALFVLDTCSLDFQSDRSFNIQEMASYNKAGNNDYFSHPLAIDSCILLQPLQRTSDNNYSGIILVRFTDITTGKEPAHSVRGTERKLAFYASRKQKNIGGKYYDSWVLSLGSLK